MSAATGPEPRVAIVGATGAVGREIAVMLDERGVPRSVVGLFASQSGASSAVTVGGEELAVAEFNSPADLTGFDLAFLAAPPSVSAEITRVCPGPLLIGFAGTGGVFATAPLVAPGFMTRARLGELKTGGLFAIPHPCAYALATILGALGSKPEFAGVTAMLGASAGGKHDIDELMRQSADLLNARLDVDEDARQRAFNIFADDEGIGAVILAQTAALLGREPKAVIQVTHMPVFHGSALAIHLPAAEGIDEWPARLRAAPGILLAAERTAAGVVDTVGQEGIAVNFDRHPAGASLWCGFDNTRIAALCAVWVAESLFSAAGLN